MKNDYQHISTVLFTLVPISPYSLTMMNIVNTEFYSVELWFPDQVSKTLESKAMSIWH